MPVKKWTQELDDKLRQLAPEHTYKVIGEMMGLSHMAIKQRARLIGINKITEILFSSEEISYINLHYPDESTQKIADHLGRSLLSIYRMARKIGLEKSEAYKQSAASGRIQKGSDFGKDFWFKKGLVPATKGKKQLEYMSAEAIERTKATRFQKGGLPRNTKEDGHISIRKMNGSNLYYKWIRVAVKEWELLMLVAFKDNNQLNCEPENLYLETVEQHMARNTIMRFDPQLREVIRLMAKYNRKIKSYEKQD